MDDEYAVIEHYPPGSDIESFVICNYVEDKPKSENIADDAVDYENRNASNDNTEDRQEEMEKTGQIQSEKDNASNDDSENQQDEAENISLERSENDNESKDGTEDLQEGTENMSLENSENDNALSEGNEDWLERTENTKQEQRESGNASSDGCEDWQEVTNHINQEQSENDNVSSDDMEYRQEGTGNTSQEKIKYHNTSNNGSEDWQEGTENTSQRQNEKDDNASSNGSGDWREGTESASLIQSKNDNVSRDSSGGWQEGTENTSLRQSENDNASIDSSGDQQEGTENTSQEQSKNDTASSDDSEDQQAGTENTSQEQIGNDNASNLADESGAIQIVNVIGTGSNKRLELNEVGLVKILMNKKVKDKPVAVISINGKFREGKSFLINFLLHELQKRAICGYFTTNVIKPAKRFAKAVARKVGELVPATETNSNMKQVGGEFKWQTCSNRVTTGIYMWHTPIIVKRADGQEVAVLLIDTQGLFDSTMPLKINSLIFVLSTIISSHQIINVQKSISNMELERLKFVAQYAKYVTEEKNVAPFQTLKFLVRDWVNTDQHLHGLEGGNEYLNELLEEMRINVPDESQTLHDLILSSYKKCDCYLFPFPGYSVAFNIKYNGDISDIDEEFIYHTKQLADLLFDPTNLETKTINDVSITCKDLMDTIKRVFAVLQDEKSLEPKFLFKATAEITYSKALEQALHNYDQAMAERFKKQFLRSYNDDELPNEGALLTIHDELVAHAIQLFYSCCKMELPELEKKYKHQLLIRLEERFNKWKFQLQQRVTLNLRNTLQKYISLLIDAKKETERVKAQSEKLYEDLNEKLIDQVKELEEKLALQVQKGLVDEKELKELKTMLVEYKEHYSKVREDVKQMTQHSQEESERVEKLTNKIKELENVKKSSKLSAVSVVKQIKSGLSSNKEFNDRTEELNSKLEEEINNFSDVRRLFQEHGFKKGFSALLTFFKNKIIKKQELSETCL